MTLTPCTVDTTYSHSRKTEGSSQVLPRPPDRAHTTQPPGLPQLLTSLEGTREPFLLVHQVSTMAMTQESTTPAASTQNTPAKLWMSRALPRCLVCTAEYRSHGLSRGHHFSFRMSMSPFCCSSRILTYTHTRTHTRAHTLIEDRSLVLSVGVYRNRKWHSEWTASHFLQVGVSSLDSEPYTAASESLHTPCTVFRFHCVKSQKEINDWSPQLTQHFQSGKINYRKCSKLIKHE